MTIDFSSTPDDSPTNTESEGSMFAPTPAWERSKKRRMFGGRARSPDATRVAEEPRSFAAEAEPEPETLAGDQRAYAFDPIGPTDQSAFAATGEPAFAATPSYAGVTARRKTSVAPVAIAAGIVLIGGLAATGWYMTQSHTAGVAQLTPGSAATTTTTTAVTGDQVQTAENAAPQAALPAASASATAPAAAAPAPVTHTTTTTTAHSSAPATVTHRTTAVAHAKAPASRSAADAGANASATLPATPQPYQRSSAAAPTPPAATPAPPLVLNIPPATTQAAPVETAPAPTVTAPPPTTATPPSQ